MSDSLWHYGLSQSLPGSSVHGILQARVLKWLPFPPAGDFSDPRIQPESLLSPALAGWGGVGVETGVVLDNYCHVGSPGRPRILRGCNKILMHIYFRRNSKWLQHLFSMGTFSICSVLPPISRYQMRQRQWCPSDGKEMRWVLGFIQLLMREFSEGSAGVEISVRTPWAPWGKETKSRDRGEKEMREPVIGSLEIHRWKCPRIHQSNHQFRHECNYLGLGRKHPWRLDVVAPDARAVHILSRLNISWFTGENTQKGPASDGTVLVLPKKILKKDLRGSSWFQVTSLCQTRSFRNNSKHTKLSSFQHGKFNNF